MEMKFSYCDYQASKIHYPTKYACYESLDQVVFSELEERQKAQDAKVEIALKKLKERTTKEYYRKIDSAQTEALTFAKKVFPTYKFILPDALADDWLSTMDWHKRFPTRDHSLHQTLTAYIMSKLLGNGDVTQGLMINEEESLLSRCARLMIKGEKMAFLRNYLSEIDTDYHKHKDEYDIDWAVDTFYETAMVAAQFHDMGYPWSFINTLAKDLKTVSYDDVSGMLIDYAKAYDNVKKRLLVYPLFGYNESIIREMSPDSEVNAINLFKQGVLRTHGLPGALGFMSLNEKIKKYGRTNNVKEATNRLIMDWVAVGIMMHDMPGQYWGDSIDGKPCNPILKLDFETDPLSCLISMADILEEFERPQAVFGNCFDEKQREECVSVGYRFACIGSRIQIEDGRLAITYYYSNKKDRDDCQLHREKEVADYFNPPYGYIDLSSWGVMEAIGFTEVKQ